MCRHFPSDSNNVGADCPKVTAEQSEEEEGDEEQEEDIPE